MADTDTRYFRFVCRGAMAGRTVWLLVGLVILAVCGAGWWAWSARASPRKEVEARTRELVAATAPLHLEQFSALLGEQAALVGPSGDRWLDRGQMLAALERSLGQHPAARQGATIQDVQWRGANYGMVLIDVATVFADQPWGERPILTRWLLEWSRADGEQPWLVARVQWQQHPSPAAIGPSRGLWNQ